MCIGFASVRPHFTILFNNVCQAIGSGLDLKISPSPILRLGLDPKYMGQIYRILNIKSKQPKLIYYLLFFLSIDDSTPAEFNDKGGSSHFK